MKRAAIAIVLFVSATASAGGHYMDNGKTITHDCAKDADIKIMGNDNTVTVTGACTKISVAGNKNVVTIASSKVTGVGGNDNTVTVEATDDVVTTGSRNKVTYTK